MEATVESLEQIKAIFEQMSEGEHEQIVFCNDPKTGLKAIIAVHDTTLGPSAGGTRMWRYAHEADALHDVLRLSRGMTYKNAAAGLNLGGGKAVIMGDARKDKSEFLFRSFGKYIESLGGKYITAEDVGINPEDIKYIAMQTKHVAGKPEMMGGGGDPSPYTAYGVFMGMKAALKEVYGSDSLEGKKVSVQGVGHVGEHLVKRLVDGGAKVYITDLYEDLLKKIASENKNVEVVSPEEIYDLDIDVYAPCALGATINENTLDRLKCSVIAGAANNQLKDENTHADTCKEKGILYAPDFLINSGGIINVYYEVIENYDASLVMEHTEKIYGFTEEIIRISKEENINTHQAAIRMAKNRIAAMKDLKSTF